ncbi:hypothetical protein BHG04_29155, partial [Klebsiella pneumoniae]
SCASLLGQWALAMGARSVSGIIRSPQHRARLEHLVLTAASSVLRQSAGAVGAGDGRPLGERDYSLAAASGAPGT